MMRSDSPPPSTLELVSLPSAASALRPLTPRAALAATYSTYVVRVHTRHGIKTISFDVLAAFFTYTAKKAAEDLGISSRTLIRVCRSLGIRRWPYLGFRSEKNVERIRQEAIENLRRKLERESSEATTSSSSSSSSAAVAAAQSCLRGASAKRLLQVKLPSHVAAPFQRPSVVAQSDAATYQHFHAAHALPMLTPPPTHHAFDLTMRPTVSPRAQPYVTYKQHRHHHHHHHTHHHHQPSSPAGSSCASMSSAASSPSSSSSSSSSSASPSSSAAMPSLSVLLEASILTAFKHEVESHLAAADPQEPHQPTPSHAARTMSMRDILNNAPMAA